MLQETCPICQKIIQYPSKTKHVIFTSHLKSCKASLEKYGHIDIELLKTLYYDEEYSLIDLEDYFNVGKGLLNYMNRIGFELRGISASKKTKKVKEKLKTTHNFLKQHPSRQIWEENLLQNEGIHNVFQRESVKLKIKDTLFEKYGVDHPMKCKEISQKCIETRSKTSTKFIRFSSIHKKIVNLLNDLQISYEIEFFLKANDRSYFYDVKIGNLLIEINGDYYHTNPKFYKGEDIITLHRTQFKASDIWKMDEEKMQWAIKCGFETLVIWENAINNNLENVKNLILCKISESNQ